MSETGQIEKLIAASKVFEEMALSETSRQHHRTVAAELTRLQQSNAALVTRNARLEEALMKMLAEYENEATASELADIADSALANA